MTAEREDRQDRVDDVQQRASNMEHAPPGELPGELLRSSLLLNVFIINNPVSHWGIFNSPYFICDQTKKI